VTIPADERVERSLRRHEILFLIPSLYAGGAERVFVELANHLDRERFRPWLGVGSEEGPFLADVRNDVEVIALGARRARTAIPAIIRLIRRLKPAAIISTLGFNLAAAAARPFIPRSTRLFLREGNSPTAFFRDVARSGRLTAALYKKVIPALYRRADCVICQSDFMLTDLRDNLGVPEKLLERIYNPVNGERVRALAGESVAEIREATLVAVGRLGYQKGFDILIRAMDVMRRRGGNVPLTIVGEGEEREALENLARTCGVCDLVTFHGFAANPYPMMARASVSILPSRYEGFANVILESLSLGTPVVATDCPGGNREVIQDGKNGWLVSPENPEALASGIIGALNAVREMDRGSIMRACDRRFSVQKIVAEYETLLMAHLS
jgi:glycosyltransferase involved in cell wall biosynthesis